jgi:translation initiation factor 2A
MTDSTAISSLSEEEVRLFKYSPNGSLLACLMSDHVLVLSTAQSSTSPVELMQIPGSFLDVEFSPKGHHLSTFSRYTKGSEDAPTENVTIWVVATGARLFSYTQKTQSKTWAVQWTENEEFFGRMVSGEVQFYESAQMSAGKNLKG